MKALRVLLISFVALALAMPAFAMNVSLSGDFRQWFAYQNMMPSEQGDWDQEKNLVNADSDDAEFNHQTRVRFTWKAEDDEKKIRGTYGIEANFYTGQDGGDLKGDDENVETRYAYIDFELPFDPMTRAYMGLQPVGTNSWVFDDNAAGVKVVRTMGNVNALLGWFRADEDDQWGGSSEDDLYALDVNYDFQNGNNLGGFVYWLDSDEDDLAWYGINGALERGNLFGGFTAIYLDGEAEDDTDIEAWMVHVEGTVKVDKAYFQLGYIYATGDDDDSDFNGFFGISESNDWTGSLAYFEALDGEAGGGGPFIMDFGLNTVYANAGYEFNEKTDGKVGFLWINSAEDIFYSSDIGTEIGYEVNAQINYAITDNLKFKLGAGYLFAGEALDDFQEGVNGESADDLYRITSEFKLSF